VKEFIREQGEYGSEIRSLWKTIRNDIQPAIRETHDEFERALKAHVDGCPAYWRARKKAESDSDGDIDVAREISRVVDIQAERDRAAGELAPRGVPRVAWVVGSVIAVAVVVGLVLLRALALM
jgi:hypothetical protein